MMNLMRVCILAAAMMLTFLGALDKSQAQSSLQCQSLFQSDIFAEKPWDLYGHYQNEIAHQSVEQIHQMNQKVVTDLHAYVPPRGARAQSIDWGTLLQMIKITQNHSVVGYKSSSQYSHEGTETGYCFGRAMYLHLLALKLGLQKESIKKIWALGPLTTSQYGLTWGYHVALLVYSKEYGWLTIDPNENKPQSFEAWINTFTQRSVDQRVRFYISDPDKQALYTGKYSRYLMGLNLSLDKDWFKHYFVDMLKAVRIEKIENLGLHELDYEESLVNESQIFKPAKKPSNLLEKLKDLFWVF